MKNKLLPLLLAGLSLPTPWLSAQTSFYGADDFTDNAFASGRWSAVQTLNGGLWSETNGRLEFTADATSTAITTSSRAQQYRVWANSTTDNTSYSDSWTATATVSFNDAVVNANGVQIIGLEAMMAGGQSGYYGLYLLNATDGGRIFASEGLYNGTSYTATTLGSTHSPLDPSFDVTAVTLRLSYHGASNTFTSAFSFDNGNTFLDFTSGGGSGAITGTAATTTADWFTTPTAGFGLRVYGALYGNGSSAGPTAVSGDMTLDGFAVSAIPEPSTYAMVAGLGALGLAFWRRRVSRSRA